MQDSFLYIAFYSFIPSPLPFFRSFKRQQRLDRRDEERSHDETGRPTSHESNLWVFRAIDVSKQCVRRRIPSRRSCTAAHNSPPHPIGSENANRRKRRQKQQVNRECHRHLSEGGTRGKRESYAHPPEAEEGPRCGQTGRAPSPSP